MTAITCIQIGYTNNLYNNYKKKKYIFVQTPKIAANGECGETWVNCASMNKQGVEFKLKLNKSLLKIEFIIKNYIINKKRITKR